MKGALPISSTTSFSATTAERNCLRNTGGLLRAAGDNEGEFKSGTALNILELKYVKTRGRSEAK